MANAPVTDIAHKQVTLSIKSDAVRLSELCLGSQSTVA
jgi:hypothetical protein